MLSKRVCRRDSPTWTGWNRRSELRGVGAKMHGFLNVLLAGAIETQDGETPEEQIHEIIACEDASAFTFEDEDARCDAQTATRESISAARDARVISFGSCSFAEPREDLRELGLMG
jgi:hypothetical protein